jgi:hypothetical protein
MPASCPVCRSPAGNRTQLINKKVAVGLPKKLGTVGTAARKVNRLS